MGNKDFSHLSFEDAYAKLEKIVEQLETSSLPLEESLAVFEEGQRLSAYCQQLLDKAELRVSQLVGGQVVPLEGEDSTGAKVEGHEEDTLSSQATTPEANSTGEKIDNAAQTA
jgi:exodeoxyribonuclease VII small subunit